MKPRSTRTPSRPRARKRAAPRRSASPGPRKAAPPASPVENAEVARVFREVAELLEVGNANPFRVRAYRNAARVLESHPRPVADLAREGLDALDALPGIGPDLAAKTAEVVRTGTLRMLSELKRQVPEGVAGLMKVPGVGPRRALALSTALGVHDLAGLERAAREGRIRDLPGFGEKSEARILRELEARSGGEERVPLSTAAQYGESLLAWMTGSGAVTRAEIAGSYRRLRETVGDLDLLVTASDHDAAVERFVSFPAVQEVTARGPTRAAVRLRSGLRVDLRVLDEESFGAGLHYFTGSKPHNIAVRRLGQARGLKVSEYGVFRGRRRVGGRSEEEVFAAVGLPWIPPELREDRGEIEAASTGRLPSLVEAGDIRGDLQTHTVASDGRDTLRAMAEAAEALGYAYLAVTDHSPAVRVAGGMDAAGFRKQRRAVDRLNGRLRTLTVLAGAEVDIRADGSLDLDDETLAALDVVVVSLHSRLDLPEEEQTRRVLRALQHPSADVLGHPTGRVIGRRRGASLDFERVAAAAADHGVALEVNAQPDRMDLDDVRVRAAIERGTKVVISTDAHASQELGFMRWGVGQARRGWARREDVLNTLPLDELLKRLHRAR